MSALGKVLEVSGFHPLGLIGVLRFFVFKFLRKIYFY
jgi:hypothetical protein